MYGIDFAGKRVVVYARYSSSNQRETSITDQIARCRRFIDDHQGDGDAAEVLSDSAMSATTMHRPAFEELLRRAEKKQVDFIVTEDMSRISRDFADAAQIFKMLEYRRIPLIGVADGIDTSASGAKLVYTFRALMNDQYIDQLRDKTMRGLTSRFEAGFSTGGLPLGYKSEEEKGTDGKVIGFRVLIDEDKAVIVRRIFDMYRGGLSHAAIAKTLQNEGVAVPRKWKKRNPGWTPETVRSMLMNRAYVGEFKYLRRQWRRAPNQKERRPTLRKTSEVMTKNFPDRVIIEPEIWDEVQERLASVRATYTKAPDGSPKGRMQSGKQNNYLLSGLLRCGVCGGSMTIHAGTSARYYRCAAQKKRGTCANSLALREDVARERVLEVVLGRLRSPAALDEMRKKVALRLGELSRNANTELTDHRERLARIEQKIDGLIDFISKGERSEYIVKTLKDHEVHAKVEKRAIADLLEAARMPVELPPPEYFMERAAMLAELFEKDPLRGREALLRFFINGQLNVYPQLAGYYVAEGQFTPLVVMRLSLGAEGAKTTKAPVGGLQSSLWSKVSCAGRN